MEIDDRTYAQAIAYSYGREDESGYVRNYTHKRFIGQVRARGLTVEDFRETYDNVLSAVRLEGANL